ncbi:MAG: DUF1501 domain-containing protein [Chitinophagaceae bacterium]|nr:DUF1501 domain-containing protein [Chitinophagaceae bacterium]
MNRRKFLVNTLPAAITIPGLLNGFSFSAYGASPADSITSLLNGTASNDHILVLIQLSGGNDGLNMVIPLDMYANYYNARTNVAIPQSKVLRLDGTDKAGLHPAMTDMQNMYNEGKLSVVQSVGYENQNFSHFRSTDIWMTGDDTVSRSQRVKTGWMGRYIDKEYPGYPDAYPNNKMPDPLAIEINNMPTLSVQGPILSMGMTISNPEDIYSFANPFSDYALDSVSANKELHYLREISGKTKTYSEIIRAAYLSAANKAAYPDNHLASQLQIVARLISGGLKTRVYSVKLAGFDTHKKQVNASDTTTGNHAKLMKDLSSSIAAFQKDLEMLSLDERVMGMTFSEFGRRIKSNASMGTDHGAAAPVLLFGKNVKKGILGKSPDIPAGVETDTNIPFQYDFRSVYASVMERWFCVDQPTINELLLKNYQSLPVLSGTPCGIEDDIDDNNNQSDTMALRMWPNPYSTYGIIEFRVKNGFTMIQQINALGRVVKVYVRQQYEEGSYSISVGNDDLPAGIYFLRLQNGALQKVITIAKAK